MQEAQVQFLHGTLNTTRSEPLGGMGRGGEKREVEMEREEVDGERGVGGEGRGRLITRQRRFKECHSQINSKFAYD